MDGFGLREAIFIVMMVALAAIFLVGLPFIRRVGGGNENTALLRRVMDELEVLHLRLDMITKRLDVAGIPAPSEEPLLPPDSE